VFHDREVRARRNRPALIPAWQAFFGAVGVGVLAYPFLPSGVQNALFVVLGASAAAAIARTAHRSDDGRFWWLTAAGIATFTIGQGLYTLVLDQAFPSAADAFYLAAYPLLVAGIGGLARTRAHLTRGTVLDAAIVTIPVALAVWIGLIDALAEDADTSAAARVVSAAYPIADAAMIALLLVIVMLQRLRRTPIYWLAITGLGAFLASDLVFDSRIANGHYVAGTWMDCGWLLMFGCFGAAALHPLATTPPPEAERPLDALDARRLALLGIAAIAAAAVVLVAIGRGHTEITVAQLVAAAIPLLILARLWMLASAHRREMARSLYLAGLVESSEDAIIGAELDGTIRSWNAAAERIFGYTAEEAIGEKLWKNLALGRGHETVAILERVSQGLRVEHFETTRRRKDGSDVEVSLSISPQRDIAGNVIGAAGIIRDVTERKRLEEQVRGAQRMEAVGQLAGGIAHDFNNLLTAVIGHCGLLAATLVGDEARMAHVTRIRDAADRAAGLTRQLLAFGRRQTFREAALDLNLLVREAAARSSQGPSGVEVVLDLESDLGVVRADATQVETVLASIVTNAYEAMPQGGRITFSTRNTELDEEFLARHPGSRLGRYVEIAVADTGTGMEEAVATRVFEPFFSTKAEAHETAAGLGLSMVYGIVKQSNGYVKVDSAPGVGSVFRVFLPRTDDLPSAPAEVELAPPTRACVLLVEDEEIVRELVTQMLRHVGYDVVAAGRPEDAVELARGRAEFDLVVTDIVMPGMSGRVVADRIEELRPGTPVLFISGYSGGSESGLREGDTFLAKPFTIDQLARAVAGLLARGR